MLTRSSRKVLICQPLLFQSHGPYRDILERAGLEVLFPRTGQGRTLTESELISELEASEAAATIASTEPYTPSVIQRTKTLRVISRTGVGFDSIHVPTATQHSVAVGVTPGTNHEAVAEQVFALLLAVTKNIVSNHSEVALGGFKRRPLRALRGRTIGIVGLGRIGQAVGERARAFGMNVLAYDPFLKPNDHVSAIATLVELDDLLSRSDFVSLHAASTDETRHMICRTTIGKMKPGSILINTARGTLVNETDLAEGLTSGHISGAGLDVFDQEPPVNSPLLKLPNVVLSPHIGGVDEQSFEDMVTMAAQTIADLFSGTFPQDRIVNADKIATDWKW